MIADHGLHEASPDGNDEGRAEPTRLRRPLRFQFSLRNAFVSMTSIALGSLAVRFLCGAPDRLKNNPLGIIFFTLSPFIAISAIPVAIGALFGRTIEAFQWTWVIVPALIAAVTVLIGSLTVTALFLRIADSIVKGH